MMRFSKRGGASSVPQEKAPPSPAGRKKPDDTAPGSEFALEAPSLSGLPFSQRPAGRILPTIAVSLPAKPSSSHAVQRRIMPRPRHRQPPFGP